MKEDKIAVIAIARDEDNYLAEWTDYHLRLGFDDIFIWQNNWRSKLQGKLSQHVYFNVLDEDYAQVNCYNSALKMLCNEYAWLAFIDVDEFFSLNDSSFTSIKDFLLQDKYKDIPALCISWRLFGDNGLQKVESFSQLERFTMASSKLDETSKPLLHTNVVKDNVQFFLNPHCVTCNQFDPCLKFVLDKVGNNKHINEFYQVAPLELNHYRNKTYAERFARCFQQPTAVIAEDKNYIKCSLDIALFNKEFDKCNTNEVENTVARDFYRKSASCSILSSKNNAARQSCFTQQSTQRS